MCIIVLFEIFVVVVTEIRSYKFSIFERRGFKTIFQLPHVTVTLLGLQYVARKLKLERTARCHNISSELLYFYRPFDLDHFASNL